MSTHALGTSRRVVLALALSVVAVTAGCSSGTAGRATASQIDRNVQAAGGILRAYVGGASYDLRIQRMSPRSDAGGGPPRCLDAAGPVQFDLNWAATNGRTAVPKVTVSIATAGGAILTLGATTDGCWPARQTTFDAMPAGTQLILSGALPRSETGVTALRVTIDRVVATVSLQPTCTDAAYAQQSSAPCADEPLQFDPANGYSAVARIG